MAVKYWNFFKDPLDNKILEDYFWENAFTRFYCSIGSFKFYQRRFKIFTKSSNFLKSDFILLKSTFSNNLNPKESRTLIHNGCFSKGANDSRNHKSRNGKNKKKKVYSHKETNVRRMRSVTSFLFPLSLRFLHFFVNLWQIFFLIYIFI